MKCSFKWLVFRGLLTTSFIVIMLNLEAQKVDEKRKDEVFNRGFKLYHLELSSWISTDLILKEKTLSDRIGGYVSYFEDEFKTVFYDKSESKDIIATVNYKENISTSDAQINLQKRIPSETEQELINVREIALKEIYTDSTGFFEFYENTSYNLIPLVVGNRIYVYSLTGPQVSGVVIFGNDYLLTYNRKGKLISKEKLHNNIIPVDNKLEENDTLEVEASIHSHIGNTSEYITETDICTLLLYGDFASWKKHYVVSEDFISIWDIEKSDLLIMTRKAWERILKE